MSYSTRHSLSLALIRFYLGDALDEFSQVSLEAFHIAAIIIIMSIIAILVYKIVIKKKG
jgi:hypothetical protein